MVPDFFKLDTKGKKQALLAHFNVTPNPHQHFLGAMHAAIGMRRR